MLGGPRLRRKTWPWRPSGGHGQSRERRGSGASLSADVLCLEDSLSHRAPWPTIKLGSHAHAPTEARCVSEWGRKLKMSSDSWCAWSGLEQTREPSPVHMGWPRPGPPQVYHFNNIKPLLVPHTRHVNRNVTRTMKIPALKLILNSMVKSYLVLLHLQNFKPNVDT